MRRFILTVICSAVLSINTGMAESINTGMAETLDDILKSPHRAESAQRDRYRHPLETLSFFDIKPNMSVVEIWPGASGWYTEILAPYLRADGKLYAAHFNEDSSSDYYRDSLKQFQAKLLASPTLYDRVAITVFNPPAHVDIAPESSIDRVLTFRNVHNWYMRGGGDERVLAAFRAFYKALKPGGLLGVVEHRLPPHRPAGDMEASGYMLEGYIVAMAEKAGFRLLESADVNANPLDTADHPKGVWTLPPTLRLGEQDKDKYLAVGESDRMTLKFIKDPA